MRRSASSWIAWLGLLISLAALVLLFYDIQLQELFRHLSSIIWPYWFSGLLSFVLYLLVISQRWRVILEPVCQVRLTNAAGALLIGRLANNLLPFRAGDLIRAVVLGERMRVSKTAVFGTVVLDRLVDTLSLLVMVVVLIFVADIPPAVKQSAVILLTVGLLAVVVLWLLSGHPGDTVRFVKAVLFFAPARIRNSVARLIASFLDGLQTLRLSSALPRIVFYSVLAWTLVVLTATLFLRAVGLELGWQAALFIVVVTNLGATIPSSPGALGVFHALVVYSLALWSIDKETALSMAIVYHESLFIFMLILGFLALWRQGYSLSSLKGLARRQPGQEAEAS